MGLATRPSLRGLKLRLDVLTLIREAQDEANDPDLGLKLEEVDDDIEALLETIKTAEERYDQLTEPEVEEDEDEEADEDDDE
jgi:hypothetical protein